MEVISKSVDHELSHTELTDALVYLADQISSRTTLQQVQTSAEKLLDSQRKEIERMASCMKSFPRHVDIQNKRKLDDEMALKNSEKDLCEARILERKAAEAIASHLVKTFKPAPLYISQERCLELENKVMELERRVPGMVSQERFLELEIRVEEFEKTAAGMDQKEELSKINDRFEEFHTKQREIMTKIQTNEATVNEKIQTMEARIVGRFRTKHQDLSDQYVNLSDKYTKLEELYRTTRIDLDSTRNRLDTHIENAKLHAAAIDNLKKEMHTLQQQISDNYANIQAKDNNIINQLKREVSELQKSLNTHQSFLDTLLDPSKRQEELNQMENHKGNIFELQNQHNATLVNFDKLQEELSTVKNKLVEIEKASLKGSSTPAAPQITPKQPGPNAIMISVMQKRVTDLQRDVKLLQQSAASTSRSLSHDASESRLAELEDFMKDVRNKSPTNMSPFSTAAQEYADLKKDFDLYKSEQNQRDQELKIELQMIQKDVMSKDQTNATKGKLLADLQQSLRGLAQSSIVHRDSHALAISQLTYRVDNLSTAELAKNMVSQLETLYPDVRNSQTIISELRDSLMDHTTQLEKIKTQITVIESQNFQRPSPGPPSNRATESLRQEVDSLSKDQIRLEAAAKATQTRLAALVEANASIKATLDGLLKTVDEMGEALPEELAELSDKLDCLLASSNNNAREPSDTTSALALANSHSAGQLTSPDGLNGTKRKAAESPKPPSTNSHTRSPSRKRFKKAEDDNEALE